MNGRKRPLSWGRLYRLIQRELDFDPRIETIYRVLGTWGSPEQRETWDDERRIGRDRYPAGYLREYAAERRLMHVGRLSGLQDTAMRHGQMRDVATLEGIKSAADERADMLLHRATTTTAQTPRIIPGPAPLRGQDPPAIEGESRQIAPPGTTIEPETRRTPPPEPERPGADTSHEPAPGSATPRVRDLPVIDRSILNLPQEDPQAPPLAVS